MATYVAVGVERDRRAARDWRSRRATPYRDAATAAPTGVVRAPGAGVVYVAIALSGMTALAAEVIWTRILSLLFGATTYTFSLILAAFLVGLGIGSSIGSAMARNVARPRVALRVVPAAVVRRDCVDGARADAVAAVLADQSVDFERPLVHDAARSGAMPVGGAAGRDPLGRELSAGAGVGRRRPDRIRPGWSAASTPPTPSARSSAR